MSILKRLSDYAINELYWPQNIWDLSVGFSLDDNPNGRWSYCYVVHDRGVNPDTLSATLSSKSNKKHNKDGLGISWIHPRPTPAHTANLPLSELLSCQADMVRLHSVEERSVRVHMAFFVVAPRVS